MVSAKTQVVPLFIWSLPWSLGFAVWNMLITQARMLGASESANCYLTTPFLSVLQRAMGCICGTDLCSCPLPPALLSWFAHLQKLWCADLSHMFVCQAGILPLIYSCLICCNFKGRDQGDPSCCHASDITLLSCCFTQFYLFVISHFNCIVSQWSLLRVGCLWGSLS